MQSLNEISIDTSWGTRTFELWQGDLTNLGFTADLLIISAIGSDYSPVNGTVIGALSSRLGISVEFLSREPDLDLISPSGRIWLSRPVDRGSIGRIMCLEISFGGSSADQVIQQAFRCLPMLETRGFSLKSICLPLLGTGSAGLSIEDLLQPILEGAQWALRTLKSANRIHFVELSSDSARKMSDAMDSVLERVKITVAKGALVAAIQNEIRNQLNKLEAANPEANRLVIERIRKAIAEESRSVDVGMAARVLRDHVLAALTPEQPSYNQLRDTLRNKMMIADWVIAYLDLLRVFGNEAAHHKTKETRPTEIEREDLTACLFVMQRVLEFWLSWRK